MWPFLKNQQSDSCDPAQDPSRKRRPLQFAQLLDGMGDVTVFCKHDKALKFWLPESAREALEEIASLQGESMSEMLRQFLAQHVYGVYAFRLMNERRPGLFKNLTEIPSFSRCPAEADRRRRIDTYWVPELGKNVLSIKLWMAKRMVDDLQVLADHSGIRLSQYVREIVISRLLGHGTLPKRPEMLIASPLKSADAWEAGKNIDMRQVEAEEYRKHDDGEVRTEWESEENPPA